MTASAGKTPTTRKTVRPAPLDPKAQQRIGRQLKALYDDVVTQPIPQHLIDLIGRLEEGKDEK